MSHNNPTACMIIIGDEILSGRTKEANLAPLSEMLNEVGVSLVRAHIISDDEAEIIRTVNDARARYDYVFTSGGIGPTHDDITTASVAKAFGVPVVRHPEALKRLQDYYDASLLNEARLKMADIPQGAGLIDNPVSAAPGFVLENVFVMAGVPRIMQAMCDFIKPTLKGGSPVLSRAISAYAREGAIAEELTLLQHKYHDITIGCYPSFRDGKMGCTLVLRSTDASALDTAEQECMMLLLKHGEAIQ
jgi:molybdenum cofactor synthesis domain-containing protein